MIKTYIKLPVEVQAVQWDGYNYDEIREFVGSVGDRILTLRGSYTDPDLIIHTLEGDHHALVGDYIIRGVKGEFYPCKPDIFEQTYEEVPIVDTSNLFRTDYIIPKEEIKRIISR